MSNGKGDGMKLYPKPGDIGFICAPYRARTPYIMEQNIRFAESAMPALWERGLVPLCPHTMTRHMEGVVSDELVLAGTCKLVTRSDFLVIPRSHERSQTITAGMKQEIVTAYIMGLPIYLMNHGADQVGGFYDPMIAWWKDCALVFETVMAQYFTWEDVLLPIVGVNYER